MTTQLLDPATTAYTISGTGPYAIDFAYGDEADLDVFVIDAEGARTDLVLTTDYTVSPTGDAASGDLTLTAGAATTHAGATLHVLRDSALVQGWEGLNSREAGLEAQLDRITMAVQEVQRSAARSLRITGGAFDPLVPVDGQTLHWDAATGTFAFGPTVVDLLAAEEAIISADAAAAAAVDAQEAAETAQGGAEDALAAAVALLASTLTTGANTVTGPLTFDAGGWDTAHAIFGTHHLWADSAGDLRLKSGAPTSAMDGDLLFSLANIIGAVGADGAGNNTGPILDIGATGGTYWIKFAGGLAICFRRLITFPGGVEVWDLPFAFTDTGKMFAFSTSTATSARMLTAAATAVDEVTVYNWTIAGAASTWPANVICFGFWTEEFL